MGRRLDLRAIHNLSRLQIQPRRTFFPDDQTPRTEDGLILIRPKPKSKQWYTGRPTFHEAVNSVETTIHNVRQRLSRSGMLPKYDASPSQSLAILNGGNVSSPSPSPPKWMDPVTMNSLMNMRLRLTQHRKMTVLLRQLYDLLPHANLADRLGLPYSDGGLAKYIESAIEPYLATGGRIDTGGPKVLAKVDKYGRAYAVGRRKTASVQVWMIRVRQPWDDEKVVEPEEEKYDVGALGAAKEVDKMPIQEPNIGRILVNNRSLPDHFRNTFDRAAVTRPFSVTGTLGAYNVFAVARGGGTTGQSGALQLGISKCLAVLGGGEVQAKLKAANLLRRDPRMVWRKRPGKVKSRKAHQWVKR